MHTQNASRQLQLVAESPSAVLVPVKSPADWKPRPRPSIARMPSYESGKPLAAHEVTPELREAAGELVSAWEVALAPSDEDGLLSALGGLSVMVAGRDDADELAVRLAVYAEDLEGIPARLVQAATIKLRRTLKWFPTLAEVRECIADLYAVERPFAIRAYAIRWVAENPKQAGWSDEEWWNYRALKAAHEWAQARGLMG